jgi:hypothetical protein
MTWFFFAVSIYPRVSPLGTAPVTEAELFPFLNFISLSDVLLLCANTEINGKHMNKTKSMPFVLIFFVDLFPEVNSKIQYFAVIKKYNFSVSNFVSGKKKEAIMPLF